jgi:hypothetical protein
MKETTRKYGKRFDEEFQRDAVRMLESGRTDDRPVEPRAGRIDLESETVE